MAAVSPPLAAAGGTLSAVQDKENLDDAFAQLLPTPATIDKRPADASPGSSPAKKRRPLQSRIVFAPAGARQGSIENTIVVDKVTAAAGSSFEHGIFCFVNVSNNGIFCFVQD
jgi:hypothetical protein